MLRIEVRFRCLAISSTVVVCTLTVVGGLGEGEGMGSVVAGFSIRVVEGVGIGVADVSGVVGAGVMGTGVDRGWVEGWGVGVVAAALASAARRLSFFLAFQAARRSSGERSAEEDEGVGVGSAGFSIRVVEGVGRGVGSVLGVVGAGVEGTGVGGVGIGLLRLLLGLRCLLVRGLEWVVEEVAEETLVFFVMSLEGGVQYEGSRGTHESTGAVDVGGGTFFAVGGGEGLGVGNEVGGRASVESLALTGDFCS